MSLIRNTDPNYWLALVVATPEHPVYATADFRKAVNAVTTMYQIALRAGQEALSHSGVALFHQSDIDAAIFPLTTRGDVFLGKYTLVLQNLTSATQEVVAPDLRNDCIEFLTFINAAVLKFRMLSSAASGWGDWVADLTYDWSKGSQDIYAALTNTLRALYEALTKGMQVLVWTVGIGGSGLLVYGGARYIQSKTR
jgi:hypothetical protein